jgi:hypothetical protein
MTQFSDREDLGKPVIDPRHGDVETDFSSTKQHSMLSLAGGLLVEISLPKLIMAWTLLLLVPGLLLGLGPIVASDWVRAVSGTVAAPAIGLWSILVLAAVLLLILDEVLDLRRGHAAGACIAVRIEGRRGLRLV